MATPAVAWAQSDAIELEFRQSVIDDAFDDDTPNRTAEVEPRGGPSYAPGAYFVFLRNAIATPQLSADLAAAGRPDSCDANENSRIELAERIIRGDVGISSASNAAQTDGGDSDVSATVRGEGRWRRLSRWGVCSGVGDDIVFSPNWDLTVTLVATASDSVDNIAGDDSSVALGFAYTHRLGDSTTDDGAFQNRVSLSLDNTTGYGDFFDDWTFTSHNLRLGVEHAIRASSAGSTTVGISGGRSFSNPEAASFNYVVLEGAHSIKNFSEGWGFRATGSAAFREYDEVTPQREDHIYTAGVSVSRKITPTTTISIGLTGRVRDSNIDTRDYESIIVPITVRRAF